MKNVFDAFWHVWPALFFFVAYLVLRLPVFRGLRFFKWFSMGAVMGSVLPDALTYLFGIGRNVSHSFDVWAVLVLLWIAYEFAHFFHVSFVSRFHKGSAKGILTAQRDKFWLKFGVLFFWCAHLLGDSSVSIALTSV